MLSREERLFWSGLFLLEGGAGDEERVDGGDEGIKALF